jgi:hypothetical protein
MLAQPLARRCRTVILTLVGVAALSGCASSGEGRTREARDPNLLTEEQIQDVRATNAYEVVQRLRNRWLQRRGSTQLSPASGGEFNVQAYLDERRLRDVSELRNIDVRSIRYIRYYPPTEASGRFGFDHGAGAIVVSTRPLER